jgi:hypothetical protein
MVAWTTHRDPHQMFICGVRNILKELLSAAFIYMPAVQAEDLAAMFEKFTNRSQRVMVLAREEARALNHSYVGSEHILLGLLREGVGVGAVALESIGVTQQAVRAKVIEIAGEGQPPTADDIPFTRGAQSALERSRDEASRLGDGYVGTESILLALTAERDGAAAQVLLRLGADLDRVRLRVTELLTGAYHAANDSPARDSAAAETGAGSGSSTFERFTDRARRVVVMAQDEARALNHGYIGTEHILLGLVREGDGVAAKALGSLGISLETLRRQVEEIIGRGPQAPSGHISFTPRGKKVLELALLEASELNHGYIGTEHILLGLVREGDGVAAQVLVGLGADADRVRQQVIQLLASYQAQRLSGPRRPTAETLEPSPAVAAAHPDPAVRTADIVDHEVKQLLDDAIREAQDAGDQELGGQHVLLAMCGHDDSGWLALRWAGASPRPLMTAAVRASSNRAPHKERVPLSGGLRRALDDGWRAVGQPLSAAALLASLMRNQETGSVQTVVEAGLRPQDVLDAIVALARIGEVDAVAGQIATIGRTAESATPRPPPAPDDTIRQSGDHREKRGHGKAQVEASGWAGPDREAAMSVFQFKLAAVSAVYLLLLVSTLITLVAAAIHGRLWLLLLAPLLGLGNPRLGTWSLLPVAALFWWLHLPLIAILVLVWIPLDASMGALMRQRHHVFEFPPENRDDLRIRLPTAVGAIWLGAGTGK